MEKRVRIKKTPRTQTHLVGDCEDLLPYAWRTPPVFDPKKSSKVLKDLLQEEEERKRPPTP